MRVLSYILVLLIGVLGTYLLAVLGVFARPSGGSDGSSTSVFELPTYLDFVSVMLTVVTVVLAAVAIGIGVVAAYTFSSLERRAEEAARVAAQKGVDEALTEEAIRAKINKVAFGNIARPSLDELEDGFDPTDTGNQ